VAVWRGRTAEVRCAVLLSLLPPPLFSVALWSLFLGTSLESAAARFLFLFFFRLLWLTTHTRTHTHSHTVVLTCQ
jgi:hypothetical protein